MNDPVNGSDPSGKDPTDCAFYGVCSGSGGGDSGSSGGGSSGQTFSAFTPSGFVNIGPVEDYSWLYNTPLCCADTNTIWLGTDDVQGALTYAAAQAGVNYSPNASSASAGSGLGGMLADNANIIQNQLNWQNLFVAAYSAAPTLSFALGMGNPFRGLEEAAESAAVAAPAKLYHYTLGEYADSIMENGLQPGASGRISRRLPGHTRRWRPSVSRVIAEPRPTWRIV